MQIVRFRYGDDSWAIELIDERLFSLGMGRNFSDAADSAIVVSAHPMCAELFYFETDANSVGVAEMLSKEDSPHSEVATTQFFSTTLNESA